MEVQEEITGRATRSQARFSLVEVVGLITWKELVILMALLEATIPRKDLVRILERVVTTMLHLMAKTRIEVEVLSLQMAHGLLLLLMATAVGTAPRILVLQIPLGDQLLWRDPA
jgi:hypothetical protein